MELGPLVLQHTPLNSDKMGLNGPSLDPIVVFFIPPKYWYLFPCIIEFTV